MQHDLTAARPLTHEKLSIGLRMAQEPMAQILAHGATEPNEYVLHRLDAAIKRLQTLRVMVIYRQLLPSLVAPRG